MSTRISPLPYAQQWSLDIERQLGETLVLDIGYRGSKGTHLPLSYDPNQPLPGTGNAGRPFQNFGNVTYYIDGGNDCGEVVPAARIVEWRTARPSVINVDGHPAYASAIAELKQTGELSRSCRCRTAPYLNNVIEQDHRFIKRRITASLGFRSVEGACRTIEGYEAMHAIRKGHVRWLAKGDAVAQRRFIHTIFGIAA